MALLLAAVTFVRLSSHFSIFHLFDGDEALAECFITIEEVEPAVSGRHLEELFSQTRTRFSP